MKIIQIPRRFVRSEWGGTESVILETSRQLINSGHETKIICPKMLTHVENETIHGIEVERVPYFYPYIGLGKSARQQMDKKGGNAFSFHLLKKLIDEKDVDLIHLHTGKRIGAIGRSVARFRNIPYVISLHGGIHDVPDSEIASCIEPGKNTLEWGKLLGMLTGSRRVLRDAAAIICVGHREYLETRRMYPNNRVVHLPNGVDHQRFSQGNGIRFRQQYNIPQLAPLALTVGRIDPQKNQYNMILNWPQILKSNPKAHLLMIGAITNENYHQKLLNTIEELKLKDNVHIINGLDPVGKDLTDAYHAADVFVLPSVHEPFGIVILEAWSAGLPVIAANVGGIRHLVKNNVDGLTYETGDNSQLVSHVTNLFQNKSLAFKLAEAGTRKVERQYDWSHICRQLTGLYYDVINNPGNTKMSESGA